MTKNKDKKKPKVEEGPHDGEISAYLAREIDWQALKRAMRAVESPATVDRSYIEHAIAEYKERTDFQE